MCLGRNSLLSAYFGKDRQAGESAAKVVVVMPAPQND
jgi:hypothetical protein